MLEVFLHPERLHALEITGVGSPRLPYADMQSQVDIRSKIDGCISLTPADLGISPQPHWLRGMHTCIRRLKRATSCGLELEIQNNYFISRCSGSEAGSYLRLIDYV